MTGQNLLDMMEIGNNELQLQPTEADVVRGLISLNIAQDFFESMCALRPGIIGDTTGTVATVANTETTAFPTGLLRLDRLHLLSAAGRPIRELQPVKRAGGFLAQDAGWPFLGYASNAPGRPYGYWTNGRSIYWNPIPDTVYTIRWYGYQAVADITAAGTFAYPDIAAFPVASLAAKLMAAGVDDGMPDLSELAGTSFEAALKAMDSFQRDGAVPLEYRYSHSV